MKPILSHHFESRVPSAVRMSQIEFAKRKDKIASVNAAVGNVSLPMHPAMTQRMFSLDSPESPFRKGVVKYSASVGENEAGRTFLHLIEASGFSTQGLYSQITDGASQGMELTILGTCGIAHGKDRPLLVIDPTYSNYRSMAERTGRSVVSVERHLGDDLKFTMPKLSDIEKTIQKTNPGALLVIPYDNPTGQFFPQQILNDLATLCVKYNLWFISDEAYRELLYTGKQPSSIWGITEKEVPGIQGRRIGLDSASKVWNGCGLRIGALITDHEQFHRQAVAESTANLCANVIGQYIFGALLHQPKEALHQWFEQQRTYYRTMSQKMVDGFKKHLPELIISSPDAALYTVIDVRKIAGADFDANAFVVYCAQKGVVDLKGVKTTLLLAPMDGFYVSRPGKVNPGKTQMRVAYVEPPDVMANIPYLFSHLLKDFMSLTGNHAL